MRGKMSLSVDNLYSSLAAGSLESASSLLSSSQNIQDVSTDEVLKSSLQEAESDEELLDACKEFEIYFMEKIFKSMQESVKIEEEEDEYTSMFGDMLAQEYAKTAVESNQGIGLAKQLYESMKRNTTS